MILDDILKILKNKSTKKAYTINEQSYTYEEFYKYICNIYEFLKKENKNRETVIVYGHKEIYMKASFLACSFAGMTYVPIDESMPMERIQSILEQVNPKLIIGDLKVETSCKQISKKEIEKLMNEPNLKEIDNIYLKPEDIYYIIFTSGSTGSPKGVKVTYNNLNSAINWLKDITKIEKGVILNQANFSFDLSVADLYLSVISESEHYIIEDKLKGNFYHLFELLKASKSTIAVMTPSFADLLLLDKSFNENLMPELKTIIFCGEKLTSATTQKLYSRFSKLTIINSYGPIECTFAVTSVEVPRSNNCEYEIPVGKPKDDVKILIVNENLNELAENQSGEILIIGDSVANGYVGNVKNSSFIEYHGKKAYLTGDIGYIYKENLYFKCRKDKQIKFKGYRIEITDIEKNLYSLNYVEKVVVVIKTNNNKVNKIIAFIKLKENSQKTEFDINIELQPTQINPDKWRKVENIVNLVEEKLCKV